MNVVRTLVLWGRMLMVMFVAVMRMRVLMIVPGGYRRNAM